MITGYLLIVLSSTAGFAAAVLTYKRPLSGSAHMTILPEHEDVV